jgi:DNA-binding NarL/FixJ family response regulator
VKVLLVDDHALVRDGLSLLLPKLDPTFVPIGVASCEEALALLDRDTEIALVLMDLSLPGMSGADGIKAIRSKYPDIPIVALSGSADRQTILQSIKSGAMGFIPKSYTGERLFGALQYILVHKGTFLPAEMLLYEGVEASPNLETVAKALTEDSTVDPKRLGLTPRQADVLYLVLQGKSNKAIARTLHIEDTTVRSHVTAVLRALNVTTRTEAVIAAHRMKLVFGSAQARVD